VQKVEELTYEDMQAVIDNSLVAAHKARALTPDNPTMGGTAQNPDVYFQGRETVNKFYLTTPKIVQDTMNKFAKVVGRQYHLFDYIGAPDAEKVIITMCSGAETVHETVDYLVGKGEKVGVLIVRLYRPFSVSDFIKAMPKTAKKIAVLDRTKEPGSIGEPLYLDVRTAIGEAMADGTAPFKEYPLTVGDDTVLDPRNLLLRWLKRSLTTSMPNHRKIILRLVSSMTFAEPASMWTSPLIPAPRCILRCSTAWVLTVQ
jgi:pyruvate-ferredoxin/flavodoxin oxidoreductase